MKFLVFFSLIIGVSRLVNASALSSAQALSHATRIATANSINIVCVTSEGLALGVIYKSKGLPRPEVLVGIDDVNRFGQSTEVQKTFPGAFSVDIPDDYAQVPTHDRLGKSVEGIDLAKTTGRIGVEKNIPCVYAMTPGTQKALRRPSKGGIRLE